MKLLRDTWLVFGRYFGIFIHNPVWVALGVLQPVLYLLLFAPLLKPIAAMRGFPPGGAYNVFVPGLLVQLGMFGAAGVGFSLISELRMGVIERLRVTPVSRVALLVRFLLLVPGLRGIRVGLPFICQRLRFRVCCPHRLPGAGRGTQQQQGGEGGRGDQHRPVLPCELA